MSDTKTTISKYISLVLRHKPEIAGIVLTQEGYAKTELLIKAIQKRFGKFDMNDLEDIVRTDEKGRYSFNSDKTMIRANQGHSTNQVNITFKEVIPPDVLFHGTGARTLDIISKEGLKPMSRQYVHLSKDEETAIKVGARHGDPVVLRIDSKRMFDDGYKFYISDNGVYLTKVVSPKYFL